MCRSGPRTVLLRLTVRAARAVRTLCSKCALNSRHRTGVQFFCGPVSRRCPGCRIRSRGRRAAWEPRDTRAAATATILAIATSYCARPASAAARERASRARRRRPAPRVAALLRQVLLTGRRTVAARITAGTAGRRAIVAVAARRRPAVSSVATRRVAAGRPP